MPLTYALSHVETPIGFLEIRGTQAGVASVAFLPENPSEILRHDLLEPCADQIREYFEGRRTAFHSLALRFASTDFQQAVWESLSQIPFGEVICYGDLAKRAGHPGAARAVGTAMNVNPLAIIIPCHRVVPSDGSVGEYASGSHRKEWLLRHERSR